MRESSFIMTGEEPVHLFLEQFTLTNWIEWWQTKQDNS